MDLQQLKGGFEAQQTDWPKAEDAPNNLYEPVESDGGVRGDFQAQAKSRSLYQEIAGHSLAAPLAAAAALTLGAVVARRLTGRSDVPLLLRVGALLLSGKTTTAAVTQW